MQEVISDLKRCIHNFSSYDDILSKDEEVVAFKKQLLSLLIGKDKSDCVNKSDCVVSDDPVSDTCRVDTSEIVVNEDAHKPDNYVCQDNDVTKIVSNVLEDIDQNDVASPNTRCFGEIDVSAKGFNEHENIDTDIPYVQPRDDSENSFHLEGSDTKMDLDTNIDDDVTEVVNPCQHDSSLSNVGSCSIRLSEDDNSNFNNAELNAEDNVAMHDELTTGSEKYDCVEIQETVLSEKEVTENANNNTENEVVVEACACETKMEVSKTQDFTAFSESCTLVSEEKVIDAKVSSVATQDVIEQVGNELTKEVLDEAAASFSKTQVVTALCESHASTYGVILSKQAEKVDKVSEANENKGKPTKCNGNSANLFHLQGSEHHNKVNPFDVIAELVSAFQDDAAPSNVQFCHMHLSEDDNSKDNVEMRDELTTGSKLSAKGNDVHATSDILPETNVNLQLSSTGKTLMTIPSKHHDNKGVTEEHYMDTDDVAAIHQEDFVVHITSKDVASSHVGFFNFRKLKFYQFLNYFCAKFSI